MRYFIILLAAWMSGCGIAEYEEYPAAIAGAFHAQDVKVTQSTFADSQSGTQRTFIATLIGNQTSRELWTPESKVASGCAKFIFARMSPEQRNDFDQIQVKLVVNGSESQFNFGLDYLALIDPYLDVVGNYLEHVCTKEYSALVQLVDTGFVTHADQQSFLISYAQIDSIHGGQESPSIAGFAPDTVNYEGKLPVMRVWATTVSQDVTHSWLFLVSNDHQPPRILAVGLNDE